MKVMIRSRLEEQDAFSDPWPADFVDPKHCPTALEQFVSPDKRAFGVTLVELRYDIAPPEVHLFCLEYPRQEHEPPQAA